MRFSKISVLFSVLFLMVFQVLADQNDLIKLGKPDLILDGNLSAPEVLTPFHPAANELDYLGDTVIVGMTEWDAQHNSTVGRMIQYDPNFNDGAGRVYVAFTDLPTGANAVRKVMVSKVDFIQGDPVLYNAPGDPVNEGHWGGYVTLGLATNMKNPLPVPVYHARAASNDPYFTRCAAEWNQFEGIYIETDVPWQEEGILIWPKTFMDGDSIVHIVSTTSEGGVGTHYSRLRYDPVTQNFSMTNPDNLPENVTDLSNFISADLTVSPDGQRVCISSTANRYELGIVDQEYDSDNDLIIWSNEERGLNWDWDINNTINVTQFQGPDYTLLPDTLAANVDLMRLWLESQCYLDYDNQLHAAFSVSENHIIEGAGVVYSQIYYWNENDNQYIRIGDGDFWNNWQTRVGVNNVIIQRPCLYKDPDTGWLWAVFQQFGVPGDTTDAGEALDVNTEGRPCSEIFLTASPSGSLGRDEDINGKLWFKPVNITESRIASTGIEPGECMSERDPSIALNNQGEYLHVSYMIDRDPGVSIGEEPEGVRTDNPIVYQRISKYDIIQRFIEQGEWIENYPLHRDSTGFWYDPDNYVFDFTYDDVKESGNSLLPDQFEITSVYPNPFNASARINFALSNSGQISLKVYDILGREVITLLNRPMEMGQHEVFFNGSDLASGIYFVELSSKKHSHTQKIILLK